MNKYSDLSLRSLTSRFSNSPQPIKHKLTFIDSLIQSDQANFDPYTFTSDLHQSTQVTSSISTLSQLVHEKNLRSPIIPQQNSNSAPFKLPEISPKSPTTQDFSDLLAKIDSVISPKQKHYHTLLTEADSEKSFQHTGEYKYYKINCKGKKCPLQVRMKIYEGKLLVYSSILESLPSQAIHDKVFSGEIFEISDNSYLFKSEHVFLGFKALVDSLYKVEISYGKARSEVHLKSIKEKEAKDINEVCRKGKEKQTQNFVERNIKSIPISKSPTMVIRSFNWESKKEKALLRKRMLFQEKRNKTIERLNKCEKRLEEKIELKKQMEAQQFLRNCKSAWLTVAGLISSLAAIRAAVNKKRETLFYKIKTNEKARLIQRFYRKNSLGSERTLLIAADSLLIYKDAYGIIIQSELNKKIVNIITSSANKNFISTQMGSFTRKIIFIQRQYREFLEKKGKRFKILIENWNRAVEKTLFSKKSIKSRKRDSLMYMNIPITTRSSILSEFYLTRWKEFRLIVKRMLETLHPYRVVRAFLKGRIDPLHFHYLPNDLEMDYLIKKSLKTSI